MNPESAPRFKRAIIEDGIAKLIYEISRFDEENNYRFKSFAIRRRKPIMKYCMKCAKKIIYRSILQD